MKCPKCGTENREGSKFCKGCGEKLSIAPPPTNVASQPKSSKNTLIICATAIICVLILAGAFVLMNGGSNDSADSSNVVNDANTVSSVDNNEDSSVSTEEPEGKDFTEAASYFPGASNIVIGHVFDESDTDGDGYLTDEEFSNYQDLVAFTKKWAVDIANEDEVITPDLWNGDGSTRTRYCADHGRIAVGDDDRCPYCEELGYDSRTRSGSTKYV